MPSSSTLALGQAAYELLDALDDQALPSSSELQGQRVVETVRADRRGGVIDNFGIGVRDDFAFGGGTGLGNILALNISDATNNLTFNDSDLRSSSAPSSDANLNILRQANGADLGLGGGDNRVNAARDLTNSEVQALGGDDTVRVGGRADGTFISLGGGEDQLVVGRSSQDLDVDTGAGDDSALFLGTLTSSGDSPRLFSPDGSNPVSINQGSNLINLGDGDDKALFRGGIQGTTSTSPGIDGYEVQLGAGDDTVEFGRGSTNDGFVLNTGTGNDQVNLGRVTTNSIIDLGWDNNGTTPSSGDTVVLGAGAFLEDSGIRSGQSQDNLIFAGSVTDTTLDLGWGDASVDVSGDVLMGSNGELGVWDLGGGSDTLVFTETSDISDGGWGGYVGLGGGADRLELLGTGYGIEFDLGNDSSADSIKFASALEYSGTVISNFGSNDILWIGQGQYGYEYEFLNEYANEYDLDDFRFANNVIWSQDQDPGTIAQDVMTVDTTQFSDGTLTAISNNNGTDTMVIADLDDDYDWVSGNIADSSPLSATSPTPDPDPYFPDSNNQA